jgi:molecular chaperone GrpE
MTEELDPQQPQAAEASGPAAGVDAGEAPKPVDATDEVRRERDDMYDRLLRKTAEFDNYRKRIERERRDFVQQATADVLEALLPIVDNFERALQVDAGTGADAYRKGVELIYKQLTDLLVKRGVKPVDALGKPFDPNFHQAITYEVCPGHEEGEVVEVVQQGYVVGERLLRPAMVKVARA